MMSALMNKTQNVKIGTWIIIAITIVLTIIFVVTNETKEDETNEYSAGHYILFAIVTFAIVTFLALKTEMSAVYSMKCIHGIEYRKTLSNTAHFWYRVLHVIPFFAGDLTNVVLFHTCTRK
jgi:hypothetical protein